MIAFIDDYRDDYGVEPICKVIQIARPVRGRGVRPTILIRHERLRSRYVRVEHSVIEELRTKIRQV
ncbi:MAG: hypothetical protein RhofKO_39790 [Rhodothermales bacterium]